MERVSNWFSKVTNGLKVAWLIFAQGCTMYTADRVTYSHMSAKDKMAKELKLLDEAKTTRNEVAEESKKQNQILERATTSLTNIEHHVVAAVRIGK